MRLGNTANLREVSKCDVLMSNDRVCEWVRRMPGRMSRV